MLSILLILCVLIWLPILLYYLTEKGFTVLLIWLLIAPVAINFIKNPSRNPFFTPEIVFDYGERLLWQKAQEEAKRGGRVISYQTDPTSIRMDELLNPTRILFLLFILVLLMDKYYKKTPLEPFNKTETLMMFFIIILVLNVILLSNRMANGLKVAVDSFFIPFVAYYVTRRFVKSEEHFRQFTQILIALGLILIGIAIIERFSHSNLLYRLRGPFPHRNQFYVVMMCTFFMTLLYTMRYHRDPSKPLSLHAVCCWTVLCLAPVIIFATWTRSNWLGFLGALWVMLFFVRRFMTRGNKVAVIGLVLLLIPLLIVGFQAVIPADAVDSRIANQNTIYARIGAWIVQFQAGIKSPIYGIGFNNVREVLANNRIFFMGVRSLISSHNCFLAFFVELGVLGLFTYLAMVYSIIRAGVWRFHHAPRREEQWLGICSIAILVGYLVPGLTSIILYVPSVSHVYAYACLGAIAGLSGVLRVPVMRKRPFEAEYMPAR